MTSTDNARLQVAVLVEINPRETRVAMTPDDVHKLTKLVAVTVERARAATPV
jgi:alanine dehydrogenase